MPYGPEGEHVGKHADRRVRGPRWIWRGVVIWLVLASLTGCSTRERSPTPPADPGPPVLLVGIDGLEWDVMLPLLQQGKMPTMTALMARGTYGLLATLTPAVSPPIWTTVATGKLPETHGIISFGHPQRDPVTGKKRFQLYTALDRKTKAVWDIVSDYGLSVDVVGWWMTFPAEPVNGVMVAQTNTASPKQVHQGQAIVKGGLVPGAAAQVYPPSQQGEVLRILEQAHEELPEITRGIFGEFQHQMTPLTQRLWDNTLWSFRADVTYIRVTEKLLGEGPPPHLLAVYFGGPDVAGHRFWRYMRPELYKHKPTTEELEDFSRIIPAYYAYIDRMLGRLLKHYPPEARVIVVSDHGMLPVRQQKYYDPQKPMGRVISADHVDTSPPGVFIAAGGGICRQAPDKSLESLTREELPVVGSVVSITPTILTMLSIPHGRDMEGNVLEHVLTAEFLAEHPPRAVRSHDTEQWLEARAQKKRVEQPNVDERIEQLRALGYIK